ncbi:MAG: shikimate dehydrogenase [Bifidobacteriaceae bacterium]|nr:shikimate dehydrogenase [Bifidobacteriaceae bacterium]
MTITNRAAVLGKPIAHSLSPVLHNAAYEALGLGDWHYDRAEVGEDDLVGFLHGLDDSWRGLSLTMPLKRTIIPFGAPSDTWVKLLGVTNTAVFDWSEPNPKDAQMPSMKLYNTDVHGIVGALRMHPARSNATGVAMIVGNGNTARSAVAALSTMGVHRIDVAARHEAKTAPLVALGNELGVPVTSMPLEDVPQVAADYDYVVSAMPAHAADGLARQLADRARTTHPMPGTLLDVIYDPRPTDLMTAWERFGGKAVGGQEMLLRQAVRQVAYMTGIETQDVESRALEAMQSALYAAL